MINKIIVLNHPIILSDKIILHEITLRPPTRGDLRNTLNHSDQLLLNEIFLLTQLTGLPMDVIAQLSLTDTDNLMQALAQLSGLEY